MRKRIVMTLFTVVLMLGLMASSAFAAAPAAPTLSAWTSGNTTLSFSWSTVTGAANYKVYKNGVLVATQPELTYSESSLTNNVKIKYEVSSINVGLEESAKTVIVVAAGGPAYNTELSATLAANDTVNDNGSNNANNTGSNVGGQTNNMADVIKSDGMTDNSGGTGTQRSHGEYQNNTNSCASCHQTHTSSAKMLLFKSGVYNTCTACHDGTLGFYNVFENGNHQASAGTFGGTETGNSSVHLSTGAVSMGAAPGGYQKTDRGGKWTGEFNCASCHAPHGSFSDRLLHYSPNNMAATKAEDGGLKVDRSAVVNFGDIATFFASTVATTPKFVAVRGTRANHGLTATTYDYIGTDVVIMVYERTSTSYTKTTNPWMYGYPTRGSGSNNHYYYTRFFTADPTTILNTNGTYPSAKAAQVIDHYDYLDETAHLKYAKGLIYGPASQLDTFAYAEIARAYVVKLDLLPIVAGVNKPDTDTDGFWDFGGIKVTTVNQRALFAGETHQLSTNITARWGVVAGTKVSTWGVAMSTWCSSCHADYLATSSLQTEANGGTGTFTTAYRHTTTSDSYTCVRCHYAHGTDVEIMRDAQNRTVTEVAALDGMDAIKARAYMLDTNPSSALKRFTNMAVCWSCHTSSKAESLKNTDSYSYTEDLLNDPRGIPVLEGKQNHPSVFTPLAPAVTANDITNVITGLASGMEYSIDGAAYVLYTTGNGLNAPDLSGNKVVQVRVAAVAGVNNAGAITTLNFTTNP